MVALAVPALLVLDAVDGRVARRTGTTSSFGARFDGEADAFLILVLSVYVAARLGSWVLVIGAARYAFGRLGLVAALDARTAAGALLAQGRDRGPGRRPHRCRGRGADRRPLSYAASGRRARRCWSSRSAGTCCGCGAPTGPHRPVGRPRRSRNVLGSACEAGRARRPSTQALRPRARGGVRPGRSSWARRASCGRRRSWTLAGRAGVAPGASGAGPVLRRGAGRGGFITARLGCDYLGVDASRGAVEIARERAVRAALPLRGGGGPAGAAGTVRRRAAAGDDARVPGQGPLLAAVSGRRCCRAGGSPSPWRRASVTRPRRAAMPDADTVWLTPLPELVRPVGARRAACALGRGVQPVASGEGGGADCGSVADRYRRSPRVRGRAPGRAAGGAPAVERRGWDRAGCASSPRGRAVPSAASRGSGGQLEHHAAVRRRAPPLSAMSSGLVAVAAVSRIVLPLERAPGAHLLGVPVAGAHARARSPPPAAARTPPTWGRRCR